jgi:hypothetical protein
MAFGISATEGAAVASSWSKSNIEHWERGFTALSKFRAREGHCRPSRRYVDGGFRLGQWVSVQRYFKDVLTTGRLVFVSNPCKAVIEGDASLARQINGVMTFANTAGRGWRVKPSLLTTVVNRALATPHATP